MAKSNEVIWRYYFTDWVVERGTFLWFYGPWIWQIHLKLHSSTKVVKATINFLEKLQKKSIMISSWKNLFAHQKLTVFQEWLTDTLQLIPAITFNITSVVLFYSTALYLGILREFTDIAIELTVLFAYLLINFLNSKIVLS